MRGRLWVVYQCQKKAEIKLQLNMHSWVCFIIYKTDFIFDTRLNALSFFWWGSRSAHPPSPNLYHLKYPELLLSGRLGHTEQGHHFPYSILLRSQILVSQSGIPELSELKGKRKKQALLELMCQKWSLYPLRGLRKIKNSRLSHQISVPLWQALCLGTGDTERVPCLYGVCGLIRETDNKQETSRMELTLWRPGTSRGGSPGMLSRRRGQVNKCGQVCQSLSYCYTVFTPCWQVSSSSSL